MDASVVLNVTWKEYHYFYFEQYKKKIKCWGKVRIEGSYINLESHNALLPEHKRWYFQKN